MTSMERPSRRVRASATAMRYWGLRILPSRVSLILTAMVETSPLCHAAIQRCGRNCPIRFCLTCVTAAQRIERVAWQTAPNCARTMPTSPNPARMASYCTTCRRLRVTTGHSAREALGLRRSDDLVETLGLDTAAHPPTVGRPDELILVPQSAEQHLLLQPRQHHRVEADGAGGRFVTVDPDIEVAEHVGVGREVRQHLGQPSLDLGIAT